MEQKYIVAFEIGSSCIKGAIAVTQPGNAAGSVKVLDIKTEHLVDKVRYGCVENPGDVASCVTNICHRLQAAHGVSPRLIKEVYIGISGRSLTSVPHEVSQDFHTETEITPQVIEKLMARAAGHTVPDKEVVAVEPGTFFIDSQSSPAPVGRFGHNLSATVSVVACKPKIRNNIKRVFNERCALNIAGYVVTPLAMGTQLLTVEERRLGVMLVDCGAETTTVAIYREGALVYLATIPMGSRNITRDITSLNCLEERAEEIKKAVGNAMPPAVEGTPLVTDGLDNSAINNIVAARADEIISNIFEQITYANFKPEQLPAGIVVTGGGSQLRGFNELLAKQTQMKVRQATLNPSISVESNIFNPNEALDVISIIADAALGEPVECTTMPPQSLFEGDTDTTPADRDHAAATPDDGGSRIGQVDTEEEDILKDDPDPLNADDPKKEKPSKRGNKKADVRKNPGFWEHLKSTLTNMMSEDDSDMN